MKLDQNCLIKGQLQNVRPLKFQSQIASPNQTQNSKGSSPRDSLDSEQIPHWVDEVIFFSNILLFVSKYAQSFFFEML